MHFDWSVNVGEVVMGTAFLIGLVGAHVQNVRKLQDVETKVDLMFRWFRKNIVNANGSEEG